MRLLLIGIFIVTFYSASGQASKGHANKDQSQAYSYAYVTIEGKGFGKKLKVDVDLGDTPEQIKESKEYSDFLTNKVSVAAVLNHMTDHEYELVESKDYSFSYQGTGGTYGLVFIMRRRK